MTQTWSALTSLALCRSLQVTRLSVKCQAPARQPMHEVNDALLPPRQVDLANQHACVGARSPLGLVPARRRRTGARCGRGLLGKRVGQAEAGLLDLLVHLLGDRLRRLPPPARAAAQQPATRHSVGAPLNLPAATCRPRGGGLGCLSRSARTVAWQPERRLGQAPRRPTRLN